MSQLPHLGDVLLRPEDFLHVLQVTYDRIVCQDEMVRKQAYSKAIGHLLTNWTWKLDRPKKLNFQLETCTFDIDYAACWIRLPCMYEDPADDMPAFLSTWSERIFKKVLLCEHLQRSSIWKCYYGNKSVKFTEGSILRGRGLGTCSMKAGIRRQFLRLPVEGCFDEVFHLSIKGDKL